MRVKLKTIYAGPNGTKQPGAEMDVSDAEAKALINGGYAVEMPVIVAEPAAEPDRAEAPESAMLDGAEETTDQPAAGAKKKGRRG